MSIALAEMIFPAFIWVSRWAAFSLAISCLGFKAFQSTLREDQRPFAGTGGQVEDIQSEL